MGRTFFKIFTFVVATVSVYAYVGQMVPQFEEHPPAKRVITPQTPKDELVPLGQELLRGKGGCLICHKDTETGNERGPDLRQAAVKAPSRRPGMEGDAYLLQSLKEPDAFLVDGYPKMMPSALKPPANLTPAEIKAVVAYLQSLGGLEPSVSVTDEDVAAASVRNGPVHKGRELMDTHGCTGCHTVDGEGGEIGPNLTKVVLRRAPQEILGKIADPTLWTAENFEAGIMPPGTEIPEGDRHEIVAYLASLSGVAYSATGAASPWSHEGVRLGLVILVFNLGMLAALGLARRSKGRELS